MSARRFPIMDGGPSIPWEMIAPHEAQALRNHEQTLAALASRGGLGHDEAVAVLTGRDVRWIWNGESKQIDCRAELQRLVDEWEAKRSVPASKLREVVADLEERKEDRIRMCDYSAHSAYEYAIDLIESLLPESE